ncbi:hypothetical protein H920_13981 [Fukomys damarensis]|uniref:Uncharacterized protein n=1 Tax=Fukomys damarensis TaxID=885580 RepID=A0A091DPF9_FUKDA|nr:hypothetical protein H920_13981 [Fukomys damarensis]
MPGTRSLMCCGAATLGRGPPGECGGPSQHGLAAQRSRNSPLAERQQLFCTLSIWETEGQCCVDILHLHAAAFPSYHGEATVVPRSGPTAQAARKFVPGIRHELLTAQSQVRYCFLPPDAHLDSGILDANVTKGYLEDERSVDKVSQMMLGT